MHVVTGIDLDFVSLLHILSRQVSLLVCLAMWLFQILRFTMLQHI